MTLRDQILTFLQVEEASTSEELALEFDSSVKTVQAVLRDLVASGEVERNFLYSESGVGRYVYKAVNY